MFFVVYIYIDVTPDRKPQLKEICERFPRKIGAGVGRLGSFHIVFPHIFNFPEVFSERSTAATAGGGLLLHVGFSAVFSFADKLDYYARNFASEKRVLARTAYFLACPLFGRSFTLQFRSRPLAPSLFLYLSRNSVASQSAAQLLKQPILTREAPRYRVSAGAGGIFRNSDGRYFESAKEDTCKDSRKLLHLINIGLRNYL